MEREKLPFLKYFDSICLPLCCSLRIILKNLHISSEFTFGFNEKKGASYQLPFVLFCDPEKHFPGLIQVDETTTTTTKKKNKFNFVTLLFEICATKGNSKGSRSISKNQYSHRRKIETIIASRLTHFYDQFNILSARRRRV